MYFLLFLPSAPIFRYDPLQDIIYLAFTLAASALFSRIWEDVYRQGVKDVAQQMQQQQVFSPGFKDQSNAKELQRYITIAASFGGMCIGLLSVSSDFLGAIGSGTGILLAVTTIYQYFETFVKEGSETGLF
ncbi:MAG: putative translocation protein, Sec family [Streblomastix strix]|uniref:Putative translocation protein, Sec family n=1 Tax=Streblomastix strix TaxID=222440 RepID=A0A5J4URD9_9EUKA|nr:MAG: putative translocation protein, Sec family [Streblomastix strix]